MSRHLCYSCIIFFFFSQQHLRKWMEVVVLTHKGGQRSDGSVSVNVAPFGSISVQQGRATFSSTPGVLSVTFKNFQVQWFSALA